MKLRRTQLNDIGEADDGGGNANDDEATQNDDKADEGVDEAAGGGLNLLWVAGRKEIIPGGVEKIEEKDETGEEEDKVDDAETALGEKIGDTARGGQFHTWKREPTYVDILGVGGSDESEHKFIVNQEVQGFECRRDS